MIKEQLQRQQPIVYQTLYHALKQHKLAHAYLFSGPKGTMKKETAYFLAQSIICKGDDFACEQCDTCRRILQNEYADMKYIDGSETSIKKDDILNLQKEFNKTGLEQAGKKIYILNHAENATPDALNSLLKFLEEPTNDMTAILIVDQLDRVLPTIVSRCQIIPFKALGFLSCYDDVKEELDAFDAYLLSKILHQKESILEASASEDYQHARYVFHNMIERFLHSSEDALLFLQLEGFPAKQKKYGKQSLQYVLDMLYIFFKECMKQTTDCKDEWYLKQMQQMSQKQMNDVAMLQMIMRAKDLLLRSVNISMLIDQLLYEMKEVTQ